MEWWIYVIVIGGVIAVYLASALIIRLLMKKAQKKLDVLFEKLPNVERERFDAIVELKDAMINDGRHLPKNMIETTDQINEEFHKIPVDIQKIKSLNDFLIIYYRKYLKEKRLLDKYKDLDAKLESLIYADPDDKNSPYYAYNKAALKYNSYFNMGILNPFKGKAVQAPTL